MPKEQGKNVEKSTNMVIIGKTGGKLRRKKNKKSVVRVQKGTVTFFLGK